MNFSLTGRKALVTGSTRGIGKSIALSLAKSGADIVLHGVHQSDAMNQAIEEIRALGGNVSGIAADLAVEGGRSLGQRVLESAGSVDILVLNASIQIRKPWTEISREEAESQLRANFLASLELIQTLAPAMQEKRWGRILTIGSVQQAKPHPDMLVYSASKAAQMNMVVNLARQLAPHGITVNNLAPGVILTDRNTTALDDADYASRMRASIPSGYFGHPGDCAGAALLLCSEAGRYITGQNLFVDGGMSLP